MSKLISEEEKVGENTFTKCFIPENDPELRKIGLEICAVTKIENNKIENHILLKMGGKTSEVGCVHTAVCQITPSPESESGFAVISTEDRPDLIGLLSMEDQYFALKSFTQALVENGIQKTLIQAIEREVKTGEEPLDFNDQMRSQLVNALIEVAPKQTKELILTNLKYISTGGEERFKLFCDEFGEVICNEFTISDIEKLNKMNGGISVLSQGIQDCIKYRIYDNEPPDEIAVKLYHFNEIKPIYEAIKSGKTVYFWKRYKTSDYDELYEEIGPKEDIDLSKLYRIFDFYRGNWSEKNDYIKNRIKERVDIDASLFEPFIIFYDEKRFLSWYNDEFGIMDEDERPDYTDALKMLEENKQVGWDVDKRKFFDYLKWYEKYFNDQLSELEEFSKKKREDEGYG